MLFSFLMRASLGIAILVAPCAFADSPAGTPTPTIAEAKEAAYQRANEQLIKRLPLRKKIGQMFMIGFKGTDMKEELGEAIKDIGPGALVVFQRNLTSGRQIVSLLAEAQKASVKNSRIPLLIGTDQEGGDVIRIHTSVPLPSELAIGSTGDVSIAQTAGTATGYLLRILGFNMNLSPVLDVSDPKQNNFVGTRTYGVDPNLVGRMGVAFSEGLTRAGVLPTGKHFPGHGGVEDDSHTLTPTRLVTLQELRENDLIPFVAMQKAFPNNWAVMLGNLAFPKIDESHDAVTVSGPLVTGVLRQELGFNGLVITDDIQMGTSTKLKDVRERVIHAIDAGADMIMVAWNKTLQLDFVNTVEAAVKDGRIKVSRIDDSLRRILMAKRHFAGLSTHVPTDAELRLALQNPAFNQIGEQILASLFKAPMTDDEREFAAFTEGKKVLMFSANPRFALSFRDALENRKRFNGFGIDVAKPLDVNRIMLAHPDAVGVFYMSGLQASKIAASISDDIARRVLLVTVETPGILKNVGAFRYIKSVYFRHPDTGKLVAQRYFNAPTDVRSPSSKIVDGDVASQNAPPATAGHAVRKATAPSVN